MNHLMTISSQSSKTREAWEFIKFLSSDTAQRMINEDGANIPARRSIVFSDAFLKHPSTPTMHNEVFIDELPHSIVWPCVQGPYLTGYAMLSQLDLTMRRIELEKTSPLEALTIMQENLNRVIARQRREPGAVPFAGSILFYICCAAPAGAIAFWIRQKRRHSHEH